MGAQGPVFRAQDTVAGQIVAVKAFKLDVSPELAPSIADALRQLVGQAPAVEGLVPLFDAGLEGETPWLAMEHLSCPTLDTRLREHLTGVISRNAGIDGGEGPILCELGGAEHLYHHRAIRVG